jgi:adenine-specific DNA methylase
VGSEILRDEIVRFIGEFSNWDLSSNPAYLEVSRGLVKVAHPEEPPIVVDPFAGGGSIPLEALRLGCDTFASDLNPVACLILKVMLEDIPRHGQQLAQELRCVGAEIKREAEKELAELYPKDPDGATPIAYLWARTVRCESPNCGAEIPLVRSFWLCKKASRRRALRHRVERPKGEPPRVEFEILEPKTEKEVPSGTATRAKASCVCCGVVLPPERVRAQLAAQRGGADVVFDAKGNRTGGARLLAVVTLRPGETGRYYRLPAERDYRATHEAQARVGQLLDDWERGGKQGLCPVPEESTPAGGGSGAGRAFSVQRYGMLQWGDLFTARQKVALATVTRLVRDYSSAGNSIREALALVIDRVADKCAALVYWHDSREFVDHVFARQALGPQWNTAEAPVTSDVGFDGALQWIAKCIEAAGVGRSGQSQIADAARHPLPDEACTVWFTDPPYYDAVPYADLSDFFFVWLKRVLPRHSRLRDPFDP